MPTPPELADGGGGGIRTLEDIAALLAFEASALGRTMRLHRDVLLAVVQVNVLAV